VVVEEEEEDESDEGFLNSNGLAFGLRLNLDFFVAEGVDVDVEAEDELEEDDEEEEEVAEILTVDIALVSEVESFFSVDFSSILMSLSSFSLRR